MNRLDSAFTIVRTGNHAVIEYADIELGRDIYASSDIQILMTADENIFQIGNSREMIALDFRNSTDPIESTLDDYVDTILDTIAVGVTVSGIATNVNIDQVGGSTTATGNGPTTSGTLRITIANDDDLFTIIGTTLASSNTILSSSNALLTTIDDSLNNIEAGVTILNFDDLVVNISDLGVTVLNQVDLSTMESSLASIEAGVTVLNQVDLSTMEGLLTTIDADTGSIDTTTTANNVLLTAIDVSLNNIETGVTVNNQVDLSTMEGLLTTIDADTGSIDTTTTANNALLTTIDADTGSIDTTTTANNVLLTSIDTSLNNIETGVTVNNQIDLSAMETLLTSIDSETINTGTTTAANNVLLGTMNTSLISIDSDTGLLLSELLNIGVTTSSSEASLASLVTGVTIELTQYDNLRPMGMGLDTRTRFNSHPELGGQRPRSVYMESSSVTTTERSLGMPTAATDAMFEFAQAAEQFQVSSTSTDDDVAGTGALTIFLDGLDDNWDPISETITLTGQTAVNTTETNWLRVNKIWVVTAGSGGLNAGDIYVSPAGQGLSSGVPTANTRGAIIVGFNNSSMGIFSVRRGYNFEYVRGNTYTTANSTKPMVIRETGWFDFNGSSDPSTFLHYQVGNLGSAGPVSYGFEGAAPYANFSDLDLRVFTETGTISSAVLYYEYQLTDNTVAD